MATCNYERPANLEAAFRVLAAARGEASIIAGGVALGILINEKLAQPTCLVDISRLKELRGIDPLPGGGVRIGALETHHSVETSALIRTSFPFLAELVGEIACGRVKNRGTVGGNVCLADPQADLPVAALALRARFQAVSAGGTREIPASGFFVDIVETALARDELLQAILFPGLPANTGVAFAKFSARKAMDYSSTVTVGIRLTLDPESGVVSDVGLGLGGMGVTPVWPRQTEAALRGRRLDEAALRAAKEALCAECDPIEDDLYSAAYKKHVCSVMLRRSAERARTRALAGKGERG